MENDELKNNLIKSYDNHAQEREARPLDDWKIELRGNFLALLQQEGKRTFLEIGAGAGKDSKFFQDNGMDVTCIDLSPEMVKLCQQKGLSTQVMDMANLQFPADSIDVVYTFNSLLHIPKTELPLVLKNIHNILKSKGLFHLGTYGREEEFEGILEKDSYTPKRFFAFYSDEHIKQITTDLFELISFKRINFEDNENHFQCLVLRKP